MGIYDRDYARPSSSGGGFGQRPMIRKSWSVNTWLIAICVAVFVLNGFMGNQLIAWLHFSTADGFLGIQFWRFFGFQFLHASVPHLLFNMIALYFFGPLVERYLGGKRYLAFYLLCGLFGAVLYMILNLGGVLAGKEVPGLLFNNIHSTTRWSIRRCIWCSHGWGISCTKNQSACILYLANETFNNGVSIGRYCSVDGIKERR